MNKLEETIIYCTVIAILSVIYTGCFIYAEQGYGYSGYRGFHHHHSFFYIRHYDESFSPSNREDSTGGSRFSKRGLNGGK